jgi:hypothetical protein
LSCRCRPRKWESAEACTSLLLDPTCGFQLWGDLAVINRDEHMANFKVVPRDTGVPFCDELHGVLESLRLSPRDAARILGVTEHTVANWLTGETKAWGRVPNHLMQVGVLTVLEQHRVTKQLKPRVRFPGHSLGDAGLRP